MPSPTFLTAPSRRPRARGVPRRSARAQPKRPGIPALWMLLALATGIVPRGLAAQEPGAPSLSSARVTAQVTAGTLAAPVAFFGMGLATKRAAQALGASDEAAGHAAYAAAYTSTWLAAAAVPAAIAGDGRFGAALGGSAAGMLASLAMVKLGNLRYADDRRRCGPLCWVMGAAVVALPGVGATVAYNGSRR